MEETMESLVDEDHADRLRTRLAVLCNNKDLCDVVLTSADGCDVQAHWLVLASSSEYFAAMKFSPIIYTDLDISELSIIVNYIYTGKVSIIPEKRDKLLHGSKKLKLNSLESLIINSCNAIAISCQQNQDINESFKSIPNQSIESQHNKQSPNLLHAWTKHNESGTSISSGLSAVGSGAGVDGQCRSGGSSVQFPVGLVQNASSVEAVPLSVSQASATQSHPGNQITPAEPHLVAWNWDPQTSEMAEGSQNEMTPHKLIENVDYKIKEEVLSEEEHNFTFFAPPESETEPLRGDSVQSGTPFNGGPGGSPGGARGRNRRTRGEMDSGSRMVSETVSTNNGGEEGTEADQDQQEEDEESDRQKPPSRNKGRQLCGSCGKWYNSRASLRGHYRQVHKTDGLHTCTFCNQTFASKDHFTGHMNRHNNTPFTCAKCPKKFMYKSSLRNHQSTCRGLLSPPMIPEVISCEHCGKQFKAMKCLQEHKRILHDSDGLLYTCACGLKFKWRSSLKKHRDRNCKMLFLDK